MTTTTVAPTLTDLVTHVDAFVIDFLTITRDGNPTDAMKFADAGLETADDIICQLDPASRKAARSYLSDSVQTAVTVGLARLGAAPSPHHPNRAERRRAARR